MISIKRKPNQKNAPAPQTEHVREDGQPKHGPASDVRVRTTSAPMSPVPVPVVNRSQDQDVTEDLIRRVVAAIDDWARANKLNSLPRHIIFQQALSIMNAVDRNLTSKE